MVHTFTALGQYLAADVNSGAVHVLDEMSYRLLSAVGEEGPMAPEMPEALAEQLPQYPAQELKEAWQELRGLQDQGLLFTNDEYIDPEKAMELPRQAVVKALCLHVSHDCNLRCRYCFASTGDFGTGHRMTMDFETAKQAIDWVVEKSGKRRNIEVDFFGGEPLMAMDTVKRTVEYARSLEKEHNKCFRFTITTNGILLSDENIDYINREMSNVVLSLDGRKNVNDHMRPTINGKGSYNVIVPKFQKLVAGRGTKDYYVRGTFTRENLDFSEDVMHLASLGFRHVSVEPASGPLDDPFAIKKEDLPKVDLSKVHATDGVVVEGFDNTPIKFAKCCSPLPGDPIVGFITRGFGVSIHKQSCVNAISSMKDPTNAPRWVKAYWADSVKDSYKAGLEIVALDRNELLRDVLSALADIRVPIYTMNARQVENNCAVVSLTIGINNTEHLNRVVARLSKIKDVLKVTRS